MEIPWTFKIIDGHCLSEIVEQENEASFHVNKLKTITKQFSLKENI